MTMEHQIARLERIAATISPVRIPCRCCGGVLGILDGLTQAVREGVGIHTRCIPTHGGAHSKGRNVSRCREFQQGEREL